MVELHFWNEHMPPMPSDGSFIGPAVKLRRRVAFSAKSLAEAMENDPRLAGVKAVGRGDAPFHPWINSAAEGIFRRLGFFVTPHRDPPGTFHGVLGRSVCVASHVGLHPWESESPEPARAQAQ